MGGETGLEKRLHGGERFRSGATTAKPRLPRASPKAAAEIIGSVRIPLATTDYLPYFQKIKDTNPEVVYVFNPGGPQATAFMKAFDDIGITKSKIKLIGPLDITSDEELQNMGRSAFGVVTLGQYSPAATRARPMLIS